MGKSSLIFDDLGLFEHGIFAENSDIRAHVAPASRAVYACRTQLLQDHLRANPGKYRVVTTGQDGVKGPTSKGLAVTWGDIPDIREIVWNDVPWWESFNVKDTHGKKGSRAVRLVGALLKRGLFPLWVINPVNDSISLDVQIKGTDIVFTGRFRIQVKCDFYAGRGGTGNLYIETHERNPLRRH